MDYHRQLDIAGMQRARSETCGFCRRAIPEIVESLKTRREHVSADGGLDAVQDISDELHRIHRMHPKGHCEDLGSRRKTRKRFTKSLGRQRPKRR